MRDQCVCDRDKEWLKHGGGSGGGCSRNISGVPGQNILLPLSLIPYHDGVQLARYNNNGSTKIVVAHELRFCLC